MKLPPNYCLWSCYWPTHLLFDQAAQPQGSKKAPFLDRLRESIWLYGVKDPILAWRHTHGGKTVDDNGQPRVIWGKNRLLVAKEQNIPAVWLVVSYDKEDSPPEDILAHKLTYEQLQARLRVEAYFEEKQWGVVTPTHEFYDDEEG